MTNRELLTAYSGIQEFQRKEREKYEKAGGREYSGKIKLSYAVGKNKIELQRALKAYEEVLRPIIEEYRDVRAEQAALEAEEKAAEAEKRKMNDVSIIIRQGKNAEEYREKISELLELDVEFEARKVQLSEFEGLDVSSKEMEALLFMIDED